MKRDARRIAQKWDQGGRIEEEQRQDQIVGHPVQHRQPKPDHTEHTLAHEHREQEARQVASHAQPRIARQGLVKRDRERQEHHHDQQQNGADVVPGVRHPNQKAGRRREQQSVARDRQHQCPGLEGRAARIERHPEPHEDQVGADDIEWVAGIQPAEQATRWSQRARRRGGRRCIQKRIHERSPNGLSSVM